MATSFRFLPRREPPDLIDLPWSKPLEAWEDARLVQMEKGQSRHVVRFVNDGEHVYAVKEMAEPVAAREYGMLRRLGAAHLPAVEAVGLVTGRETPAGERLDGALLTRFLDYSLPFRYLFSVEGGAALGPRLIDAAVVLVVRLHVDGFYWGDCSLSNLLFRRDAGALMAYLVDAETAEEHHPLSDGLRRADLEIAQENIAGGLMDLEAERADEGRSLDLDVLALVELLGRRYNRLWSELTGTQEVDLDEGHQIDRRIRRLNELGFDVGELMVERDDQGARLRMTPTLVEEGHHARELRKMTGLEVQENQARRLLNDIAAYRAFLSRVEGRPPPEAVAAARWLAEVYEPVVAQVPPELRGRLEPPELFHELLEHRYYLSEAAGHEVDNQTSLASYLDSVLRFRPQERTVAPREE